MNQRLSPLKYAQIVDHISFQGIQIQYQEKKRKKKPAGCRFNERSEWQQSSS